MIDEREALAADFVLGLVDADTARQCEADLLTDPVFARHVAAWQARLAPLDAAAPQLPPSAALWGRIAASLEGVVQDAPVPAAVQRTGAVERPGLFAGVWRSLGFWRGAAVAGALACLVLAVGLQRETERANTTPVYVAVLLGGDREPAATVNVFADGSAELVPIRAFDVPEGRAIEIWTLWDRSVGPRSVGLVPRAQTVRLRLEGLPRPVAGQLFEMTLEPAGGSPTGRPTGPVLTLGRASQAL